MSPAEKYRMNINELFEEWKSKIPSNGIDHKNNVFISDGIVCPEQWFEQKVRPLFLLKEAYHGEENWDLISEHLLTNKKIRSGTWRRVSEWTPCPQEKVICSLLRGLHIAFSCFKAWLAAILRYFCCPYLKRTFLINICGTGRK